jgi:hypothetical protein
MLQTMRYFNAALLALAIGCSTTTVTSDEEFHELGITSTESKNFFKGLSALLFSCKQSDSMSIQACQFFKDQTKSVADQTHFFAAAFYKPDSLSEPDRAVFYKISLIGAAYREYVQSKRAQTDSERFWNSFAAGAAVGTLLSRPPY